MLSIFSIQNYIWVNALMKNHSCLKKSLLDSGLSDILRVHLNPNGEIVAIGYSLAKNDYFSSPNPLGNSRPPPQRFNTTVLVHHGELGPV
jgi:hypothetical protein